MSTSPSDVVEAPTISSAGSAAPDSATRTVEAPPIPPHQDQHHEEPGRRLFVNRPKVYVADVKGLWRRIKWGAVAVLLGLYYVVPWLRWERAPGIPDQAVLVDMTGRRLYFFWIEIWPQEVYYLTGLLIIGALGIFFASTLFGRVWCGYACPQTVWTDLFMWVERKIEGDRNARIRLDREPMSAKKLSLKAAKHGVWMFIAVMTGGAWVFYFNDAPTLFNELIHFEASSTVVGFILLFSFFTYFLAGFGREQLCIYLCPWRSFQAAMVDEDTFLVTYEGWRGEGRAPMRRSQTWDERVAEGHGDCIDCKACLHVCPTGTDIRKGQQISCIGCGLCIDACNDVMRHIGRPENLIRFDTQTNQVATEAGGHAPVRLLRPRTIIYTLIMVAVVGFMGFSLLIRPTLDVTVQRDRAPLYVTLSDGTVQNALTVKILNMTHQAKRYDLSIDGLPKGATLAAATLDGAGDHLTLNAAPDSVATYRVFVRVPGAEAKSGSMDITVLARDLDTGEVGEHPSVFMAP